MTRLEEAIQEIKAHNDAFEDWKRSAAAESENVEKTVDGQLDELREWKRRWEDEKADQFLAHASMLLKTTYIRWGRTSCPGNGSEAVYEGFAGGSHYSHKGAASSMLCLPKDPDWDAGKVSDTVNSVVGLVYGTEYEDGASRSDQLFGKNHHDQDVPCVVCDVRKRSSVLMIPGKTKCHTGWTLEYSGYLMAGLYDHPAATDHYCIDKEPENLPTGGGDANGHLLYFVESRCGALRCPPYVNGRELQCAVCTK